MLAERALGAEGKTTHHHHIDELLKLFPTLQFGMDVNPKFTVGPSGVEYTTGLSAFDLMGVELVHGWLIDTQDEETSSVIGAKTYNELTEMMIMANEASVEIHKIEEKIQQLERKINDGHENGWGDVASTEVQVPETEAMNQAEDAQVVGVGGEGEGEDGDTGMPDEAILAKLAINDDTHEGGTTNTALKSMQVEMIALKELLDNQTTIFKEGTIVNDFLSSTSTQLTYSGLTDLHNHVKEGKQCVFFRNNHFATMCKHNGILYLLVTDLGYANVPEVMWEKLDDISGDTEYADQEFVKTKPRAEVSAASGHSLSPEQLLAQSSRSEADYQLALQLSRNENAIDEQEGKLIAAATEASLQAYNNEQNGLPNGGSGGISPDNNTNQVETLLVAAREEEDRMVAMQLQATFEEDDVRDQQTRQQQAQSQSRNSAASSRKKDKPDGCVIC